MPQHLKKLDTPFEVIPNASKCAEVPVTAPNTRLPIWQCPVRVPERAATSPRRSEVERGTIRSSRPYLLEPRTPELACTGYSESLPGSTLGRPSEPGRNHLIIYGTTKCGRGAGAGGGLDAPAGWLQGSGA
eukprot:5389681-Pleurochrysis_carterae.AAC.1